VILYVDTAAAMKLVVEEAESAALAEHLERAIGAGDSLVSSLLLHTELHCAAHRRPEDVPAEAVAEVLAALALVDVERSDLTTAPLLPGPLRSADAVHLATALRVGADRLVTYDGELTAAAPVAGIPVLAPR
jgi:predicted nucleic acid-binding protein